MTMTKKTVDRRVTVSGIRYWTHWTITANLDIEFEQNPNTGLWQHTATHVGVEDGDITAVHDKPNAYPVLKFSNGSGFKAVDWARKTAEIGMNLGDKDDWIDAVYSSNADRSSSMSCVAFGVAPLKPRVWARMRSDFCASVMAQVLLNMVSLLVCGVVVWSALGSPCLPDH